MKLRLSERAEAHLGDIRTYTIERFGVRQWLVYSGALEEAFANLMRFPEIGLTHEELPSGYLAFRVREHWICDRLTADAILIDGIVKYIVQLSGES